MKNSIFALLVAVLVSSSFACSEVQFTSAPKAFTALGAPGDGVDETDEICTEVDHIDNGGFEAVSTVEGLVFGTSLDELTITTPAWDVYEFLPSSNENDVSWYRENGAGIEVESSGVVTTSHSGNFHIEMDSHKNQQNGDLTNSKMSQDLDLEVGSYTLNMNFYARTDIVGDNTIAVYLDDELIFSFDSNDPTLGWQHFSEIIVIEEAGPHKLSFEAQGLETSRGGLLDDISLVNICSQEDTM